MRRFVPASTSLQMGGGLVVVCALGCSGGRSTRTPAEHAVVQVAPPPSGLGAESKPAVPATVHAGPTALWPKFETHVRKDRSASSSLWMVFADGHESLLLDLEPAPFNEKTDAPMLIGNELRAYLQSFGVMYVEIFASGFDLNRDGLGDCIVGMSGAGNGCPFQGKYYVLFSEPGGRARASEGFAECDIFSGSSLLDTGSLRLDFVSFGKPETTIVDASGRASSSSSGH